MYLTGLVMGILFLIFGVLSYLFGPRIGPNQWFGISYSYCYLNKEIWDKCNRFGGAVFITAGAAFIAVTYLFYRSGWSDFLARTAMLLLVILGSITVLLVIYFYAKSAAYCHPEAGKVHGLLYYEGKVHAFFKLTPIFLFVTMLLITVFFYSELPQTIVIHFDTNGIPDTWSDKISGQLYFLGIAGVITLINYALVYKAATDPAWLARRYAVREGFRWMRIESVSAVLSVVLCFLLYLHSDAIYFNLVGNHLKNVFFNL